MDHLLKNVNVRYTQLYFIELTRGQTIPKANVASKKRYFFKGETSRFQAFVWQSLCQSEGRNHYQYIILRQGQTGLHEVEKSLSAQLIKSRVGPRGRDLTRPEEVIAQQIQKTPRLASLSQLTCLTRASNKFQAGGTSRTQSFFSGHHINDFSLRQSCDFSSGSFGLPNLDDVGSKFSEQEAFPQRLR